MGSPTYDQLMSDIFRMIEDAQREANLTSNPVVRQLLLGRRDILTEIRQRIRQLHDLRERLSPQH